MCSYPANKKVNPAFSEYVFTDHAVIIAANVKYYPICATPQKIRCTK